MAKAAKPAVKEDIRLLTGAERAAVVMLSLGEEHSLGDRFHSHPGGPLSGLGTPHSVGQNIQSEFGFDQAVVFIVRSDAALVRECEGFQHPQRPPSDPRRKPQM